MQLSIRAKLFLMFFAVIVVVSGSIGSYFYINARDALMASLQQRLQNSAALVAGNVEADRLRALQAKTDTHRPEYQATLAQLREWVKANRDLAYIYIMRLQENGEVRFVVDSDDSAEQAMPGSLYKEATPQLMDGFERPSVDTEITHDEWGSFLTGYAPLPGGRGEFLLGIDMRAGEVDAKFRELQISGVVSLVLSLLFAWAFSAWFSRQFLRPVHAVINRCQDIADGCYGEQIALRTGDELDKLVRAFNHMSRHLKDDNDAIAAARLRLEEQQAAMDAEIARRTTDLSTLNAELLRSNRALKQSEAQLTERLIRDELTGLHNRRGALDCLEDLRRQAQRGGRSFSLVLILLGQAIDDEASSSLLLLISGGIRQRLRSGDILARFDARQFLVVMPESGESQAEAFAIELSDHLSQLLEGDSVPPRYFGVAEFRLGESVAACLERAWLSLPKLG